MISEIRAFIDRPHISDSISSMEQDQDKAIAYAQYIGERVNAAEESYSLKREKCLDDLRNNDEETETTRKAKLESWVSSDKRTLQDLKTMFHSLRSIRMALAQAIKTRRSEMEMK